MIENFPGPLTRILNVGVRASFTTLLLAGLAAQTLAGQASVYKFSTTVFGTTVVIPFGLKGLVYELPPFTQVLPDFESLQPITVIYTNSLDVPAQDFMQGFPGIHDRFEWFAIDYTGNFWIRKPGKYKFALTSDDGAKLYIDDAVIIDNDGTHPPITRKGSARLREGVHRIRVSYFQGPRFSIALILRIAGPSLKWHTFNTDELKPPADAGVWRPPSPAN